MKNEFILVCCRCDNTTRKYFYNILEQKFNTYKGIDRIITHISFIINVMFRKSEIKTNYLNLIDKSASYFNN